MQSNIYAQKDNGDLRLVAEIEGESDPALAVDALLDEMPRLKQRSFVVINLDNVMVVEAEDEIIQPRRKITVSSNGSGQAIVETEDDDEDEQEEESEDEEAEEEAPSEPTKARRAAGRQARGHKPGAGKAINQPKKPTGQRRRQPSRKTPAKKGGSPFKANPASAE